MMDNLENIENIILVLVWTLIICVVFVICEFFINIFLWGKKVLWNTKESTMYSVDEYRHLYKEEDDK